MDLPPGANTYAGACLVVCTATCVWDDLSKVPRTADVMCVNDIGLRFPGKIEHWYSSHADAFPHYRFVRRPCWSWGTKDVGPRYTHTIAVSKSPEMADVIWHWPGHGNSGLNAIYTALGLGYGQVFVCGLPMDNTGHFNDGPSGHWLEPRNLGAKWTTYGDRKNFKVWENAMQHVFDGRVCFMSGRFAA